MRLKLKVGISA